VKSEPSSAVDSENWRGCNSKMRQILQSPLSLVYMVMSIVIYATISVMLVRAGLGGIVAFLPVSVLGVASLYKLYMDRQALKRMRKSDKDFDEELKDLLDGNYL
jgi:Flp pilus assembly protein TadB